jgi:hypothetical protein
MKQQRDPRLIAYRLSNFSKFNACFCLNPISLTSFALERVRTAASKL